MARKRARRSPARWMLTCVVWGFVVGALPGVLYILVGWLPGALALHAENPHFTDPWTTVWTWASVYGGVLGTIGAVVGLVVGLLSVRPGADQATTLQPRARVSEAEEGWDGEGAK